ncbi:MAG: PAS domain S-box protein [Planctomycetia bacterium]|nr:PAS domain S-box protein [Planctomycetia bacterium]
MSPIAMDVGLLAVAAIRDVTERAEVAQKLRDAKVRYRALFEQSSDGVVVVDPETGNVLEFSDRAPLHLGYTHEEFAQLGISDIEALETPAEFKQHAERIATTGSEVFETKHRTKQGEIRDVEVRATRITVGNRPLLQASWHDVTDRKQVEISLRQSEGLYRSLVEMLPQGIFRKDADGRVTFANQRYCNLVGREVDDVVGKTDLDLFPHDLAKKYQRDDRHVMETGEILETIDEHHGADGAERFVHSTSSGRSPI